MPNTKAQEDMLTGRTSVTSEQLAVLRSLEKVRLLATAHIQRLHINDGTSLTNTARTRAVLRQLSNVGLIRRVGRTHGNRESGPRGNIYCLTQAGLAACFAPSRPERANRRLWATQPYFQAHLLAIAEVYVSLRERERQSGCVLLSFEGEPTSWRSCVLLDEKRVTVRPDAYLLAGCGSVTFSYFLEVDLGTETPSMVEQKCARYLAYWRTEREERLNGVFPLVVWLVEDEHRRELIAALLQRLPREARALFSVALLSDTASFLMPAQAGRG